MTEQIQIKTNKDRVKIKNWMNFIVHVLKTQYEESIFPEEILNTLTEKNIITPKLGGFENAIAIIPTLGIVIRVHASPLEYRTKEYVLAELNAMNILSANTSTPKVMKTLKNEYLFYFGDQAQDPDYYGHGCIFEYIDGNHFLWSKGERRKNQAMAIAREIGKVHSITRIRGGDSSGGDSSPMEEFTYERSKFKVEKIMKKVRKYVVENKSLSLEDREEKYLGYFKCYEEMGELEKNVVKTLPHGLIHGDIHEGNVLFKKSDDENKINVSLLDWEDASNSPLIFDLSLALIEWCATKTMTTKEEKKQLNVHLDWMKEMIEIYEKERELELTLNELKLLWDLIVLACLKAASFLLRDENREEEEAIDWMKYSNEILYQLYERKEEFNQLINELMKGKEKK